MTTRASCSSEDVLNVLHIDDGKEWRGGQHQVYLLTRGLVERGVNQRVLTPRGSSLAIRLADIHNLVVEYTKHLDVVLAGLLHTRPIDIIHAHRGSAHHQALAAHRIIRGKSGRATQPLLITTRRVDFPIGHAALPIYRDREQHYIAVSSAVRNVLLSAGVCASRIDIVRCGVPPLDTAKLEDREHVRKQWGIGPGEIALGTVGALTRDKGHRFLIEALPSVVSRIPDSRFLIFGDGELAGEIQRQIRALRLDNHVRLMGHLDDVRHRLAGLDIYVHPARQEGLGTSILDAMLHGLPVVATRAGGIPDVVEDGKTGLLVRPADSISLSRCLIKLLEMDRASRVKMAERGRCRAASDFNSDSMVEGTRAVYQKLLLQNT